jgi:hypothetical protein
LCNEILTPGLYTAATTCSLGCALGLDAQGDANAVWTFQCGTAFTVAAAASVFFTNAGSPDNVLWDIGAATTTGAGTAMIGNLISVGALTLGADASWTGTLSTGAATNIGADSTVIGNLIGFGAITVGANVDWTGTLTSTNGAITLGVSTKTASMEAAAAITLGASAETGDLTSTNGGTITLGEGAISRTIQTDGIITLAAIAETCDLISTIGAITVGAGAKTGAITTDGAMVLGASAESGDLTSTNGAVTLGADAKTGTITTTGVVVYGAGAQSGVCGNEDCGSTICTCPSSGSVPTSPPTGLAFADSLVSQSSFDESDTSISCESGYVFCEEISTCFSDPMFNNRKVVMGEESWGWSIKIRGFFDDNSDAELLHCGIYVGGDSGSCSAGSGVRVGTVEIKKDSVAFLLHPGSKASSFQLYAGKCEGSDSGGHLMNGDDDSSCDAYVVQKYARRPESYPLNATLDSSATNFTFTSDNQQDYMKPDPWGNSEYNVFKLSGQDYLSIHADVCTPARAGSFSSFGSGSDMRRRDRSLQAIANAITFRQSWPTNLMPQGPTYHASSSASRFPTASPTIPRREPVTKIPTAAPSSLPSSEPPTPPTTAPSKFRPSWPTNLMPQGPTYLASSSASRFPTASPTIPRSEPVIKTPE